jgi:hypothetical protein
MSELDIAKLIAKILAAIVTTALPMTSGLTSEVLLGVEALATALAGYSNGDKTADDVRSAMGKFLPAISAADAKIDAERAAQKK